jgi:hypothetical protein
VKKYPIQLNAVHYSDGNDGGQIAQSAWCRFVDAMEGRLYGYEPTRDAWAWFLAGWHAHIKGPRNDHITFGEATEETHD